jgi:hypothetical protein
MIKFLSVYDKRMAKRHALDHQGKGRGESTPAVPAGGGLAGGLGGGAILVIAQTYQFL